MTVPVLVIIFIVFILTASLHIVYKGFYNKASLYNVLFRISVATFVTEFILMSIVALLEQMQLDYILVGESVVGSLIVFLCWFYFIPPVLLFATTVAFIVKLLTSRFGSKKL